MSSRTSPEFELAIAAAADDNYAWPATLALLSAATRTRLRVVCLLFGDEVESKTAREIEATFAHRGIPFEYIASDLSPFSSLPTGLWWFTRAAYARFLVAALAKSLSARSLYLDADTLVVGDVAELARLPLPEHHVAAAVPDRGTVGDEWWGIQDWRERGMEAAAPYLNSGVILIDNKQWLRAEVSARAIETLADAPELAKLPDQNALNIVLYGRWTPLAPSWNYYVDRSPSIRLGPLIASRRTLLDLRKTQILHFWATVKPWDSNYPPGALTNLYRRRWQALLPVPPPPSRTFRAWLRDRHPEARSTSP